MCAWIGAVCRMLLAVGLGLEISWVALTILPMIIPEKALMLYPLYVLIGTSLLMMSALYLFNPVVKRQCASI